MTKKHLIAAALGAMTILAIGATVSTITTTNLKDLPAAAAPALTDSAVIVTNGTTARLATLTAIKTTMGLSGLSLITNAVVRGVVTNGDGSITVTTTNLVYLGLRP